MNIIEMCELDWTEIRHWLTLAIATGAGIISYITYWSAQRQRRLENSFRMIKLFNDSIEGDDIARWEKVFHGAFEAAEINTVSFYLLSDEEEAIEYNFSDLFTEGPPDDGAIARMVQVFDLIGHAALNKSIDAKVVYFQLGQIMESTHLWLSTIEDEGDNKSFLQANFPAFDTMMRKYSFSRKKWPMRMYTYV
jgi:hypothetical protein